MQITHVPPLFLIIFALAFICALALMVALALLTRRLGVSLTGQGDLGRIVKTIWSGESQLTQLGAAKLVWTIRGLFLCTAVGVASMAVVLYSAAE